MKETMQGLFYLVAAGLLGLLGFGIWKLIQKLLPGKPKSKIEVDNVKGNWKKSEQPEDKDKDYLSQEQIDKEIERLK